MNCVCMAGLLNANGDTIPSAFSLVQVEDGVGELQQAVAAFSSANVQLDIVLLNTAAGAKELAILQSAVQELNDAKGEGLPAVAGRLVVGSPPLESMEHAEDRVAQLVMWLEAARIAVRPSCRCAEG